MQRRVIILLGQRERSGTNFIGSTVMQHPDVVTVPPNKSLGEFNLFRKDDIVRVVFKKVAGASFGIKTMLEEEQLFLQHYGSMWIDLLDQKFNFPPNKTIFIKSPLIYNVDLWKKAFPESKIAILYRDGRDNVISCVRTTNDIRKWYTFRTKIKKKINFLSGRSFISNSRAWSRTGEAVAAVNESEFLKKVKYEELVNSKEGISELLKFYDLSFDDTTLENCMSAPVVGSSSFRGQKKEKNKKPNWTPDYDKSKYNFTNKWNKWGPVKKFVFKILAGKTLITLGYEDNGTW